MTKTRKAPRVQTGRSGPDLPVLGLFFLSGASALIYEVVWGRVLTFIFGGTAFAIATVLAAYMAGLALGSWVFGRRIDRRGHPLLVYGALEAGIAAWALILPLVLAGLNGFYGVVYRGLHPGGYVLSLIRFALSFLVLLVPTILMGGTLPVLSKLLVAGRRNVGVKAGLLYGMNTAGAVAGTAAAGFLLIPALGMTAATWVAVVFNVAVALIAVALTKSIPWTAPAPDAAAAETAGARGGAGEAASAAGRPAAAGSVGPAAGAAAADPAAARLKRTVLLVYAASGFAALAYELAWTKVLAGALGTTTYAFSAMLTTFLLGLALGSFIMARLADRYEPARLLAWSQLAIGLLGLAALPLFGNLPIIYIKVMKAWGPSWGAQTLTRFALCAVSMLPPTLLMGGTFPLVMRIYADRAGRMGEQVGRLYASNTFGAILGSFSAGFILIPLLGRQGTILTAVTVNVLSAALLYVWIWPRLTGRARLVALSTAAVLVPLAVVGGRPWDKKVMTSGAYVYASTYAKEPDIAKAMHDPQLLFFKEETEAIVAVMRTQHVLSLRINGKVDASSAGDMITQKMVAHLPMLFHPDARDMLMLGLASGVSLRSSLVYPDLRDADCLELLASMSEACRLFSRYNRNVLDDPRAHVIINDGRNQLQLSTKKYDVIISQPSNPWIVGIGSLFTHQYFDLGAARLNPGGVFCQWVQTYQMTERDFGSILKTFGETFPHMSLWMGAPGDMILLGSQEPLKLDYATLSRRLKIPAVAEDLKDVGITDVNGFMQGFVGDENCVRGFVLPKSRTITDDNLLLEFSMPKNIYKATEPMMSILLFQSVRQPYTNVVAFAGLPADSTAKVEARFEQYRRARSAALTGIDDTIGADHAGAIQVLGPLYDQAPTDPLIGHYLASSLNEIGIHLLQGGQDSQALQQFERAAQVGSAQERALALNNIGLHFFQAGQKDSAATVWQKAADLQPENPIIRFNLALVYESMSQWPLAEREYRAAIETDPENSVAMNNLAWILTQTNGNADEAARFGERAVKLDRSPGNLDTYGWALSRAGRKREAEAALREAVSRSGNDAEMLLHFGQVLLQNGKRDEARTMLQRAVNADTQGDLGRQARESLNGL